MKPSLGAGCSQKCPAGPEYICIVSPPTAVKFVLLFFFFFFFFFGWKDFCAAGSLLVSFPLRPAQPEKGMEEPPFPWWQGYIPSGWKREPGIAKG